MMGLNMNIQEFILTLIAIFIISIGITSVSYLVVLKFVDVLKKKLTKKELKL